MRCLAGAVAVADGFALCAGLEDGGEGTALEAVFWCGPGRRCLVVDMLGWNVMMENLS